MDIDVIGTFLPPSTLSSISEVDTKEKMSEGLRRKTEDEIILNIVEQQLEAGLKFITSGGIRWRYWDKDFFFGLEGITRERLEYGHIYSSEDVLTDLMRFTGRIGYNPSHPFFDDLIFIVDALNGRALPRQIIPSPAELYVNMLLMTDGRPEKIYCAPEKLLSDIAEAYRLTVMRFYELGCRSIIFDDTVCGRLCEDNFTKRFLQGGIDIVSLQDKIIGVINDSLSGLPDDLEAAIYLSGGDVIVPEWEYIKYPDNIMPRVLSEINVDKFFMPFNTDDDYAVEILRYVPKDKKVVLGLADAHTPFSDDMNAIKHFTREAHRHVGESFLAIGTKTGFNLSNFAPRGLDYNDQWRKINSLRSVANELV